MIIDFLITKYKNLKADGFMLSLSSGWVLYSTEKIQEIRVGETLYLVIGDLINSGLLKPGFDLKELCGNFYLLEVGKEFTFYSSLWSLFPLFYTEDNLCFSNSVNWLQAVCPSEKDPVFFVENILFNYAFSDRTLYSSIKRLPTNAGVIFRDKGVLTEGLQISGYIGKQGRLENNKAKLADLFIDRSSKYFPDKPFSITFTSGFDGRTLVASAIKHGREFSTCSFGAKENDDVRIPSENARDLGLDYRFFDLKSDDYLQRDYFRHVTFLQDKMPGFNGYLYPHFSALSEHESQQTDCILTGFAGSELFRALHLSGAVVSTELVSLFRAENFQQWEQIVRQSPKLLVFNPEEISDAIEQMLVDTWEYRQKLPHSFSINQQFYVFVFDEVFRKVFGAWVFAQSYFSRVRTPFLDWRFVSELLKSDYAGVNNDFFTDNPLKRTIGQQLYAEIIRRCSNDVFRQKTGKGYRPADLYSFFGYLRISYSFIKKKIDKKITKNKQEYLDNLGLISGFERCSNFDAELQKTDQDLFNVVYLQKLNRSISPFMPEDLRDLLFHSASLLPFVGQFCKTL